MRNPKTKQGVEISGLIYFVNVYATPPDELQGRVNPQVAKIENDADPIIDLHHIAEEDWEKTIEEFRDDVQKAFENVCDSPSVEFDFEIDDQMKREEELHG